MSVVEQQCDRVAELPVNEQIYNASEIDQVVESFPNLPQHTVKTIIDGSKDVNVTNVHKNVFGNIELHQNFYNYPKEHIIGNPVVQPTTEKITITAVGKEPDSTVEVKLPNDSSSKQLCDEDKVTSSNSYNGSVDPAKINEISLEPVTVDQDVQSNYEPISSNGCLKNLHNQDIRESSWCTKRRLIVISGAVLTGIVIIVLVVYSLTPGDLLNTTIVASTVSVLSDTVGHIPAEHLLTEFTTAPSVIPDNPRVVGQNKEKNKTVDINNQLRIISRAEWDAVPPRKPLIQLSVLPASRVIVSETSTESCEETEKCTRIVRAIQRSHTAPVISDIAYNFLVGGDGLIYEGRGWDVKGKIVTYHDQESISIAFIGTFSSSAPPENQVQAALKLIQLGVESGKINTSYKLYGEKQLTYFNKNPGAKLYDVITKWSQWQPGIIGVDFHKPPDEEYNENMLYLKIFDGTGIKYIPKRGIMKIN